MIQGILIVYSDLCVCSSPDQEAFPCFVCRVQYVCDTFLGIRLLHGVEDFGGDIDTVSLTARGFL